MSSASSYQSCRLAVSFVAVSPLTTPQSQRTAPHPSVNTITEYSLTRSGFSIIHKQSRSDRRGGAGALAVPAWPSMGQRGARARSGEGVSERALFQAVPAPGSGRSPLGAATVSSARPLPARHAFT